MDKSPVEATPLTPEVVDEAVASLNEKAFEPVLRRHVETIYEMLLDDVQDYLKDNARFNIGAQITLRERMIADLDARIRADAERIKALEEALTAMVNAYWRGSEDSEDEHAPTCVKLALSALHPIPGAQP